MNPDVLEKVLSCKRLPSLPAVAARVLELMHDGNVSMRTLAETVTNDQGLAAKVLRTVNSSFYGLAKPCGSINQAIVMLGLSAVKTLALGFSLASALSDVESDTFDHVSYWRRGLYTGIAARAIAREARIGGEEECFLGGLLQDVGMIALDQALGPRYRRVLAMARGDHRQLARHELAELEVQHPDIGALLAARWKLPQELCLPVKYHERPTAAPNDHHRCVRAVALGNIVADVLSISSPQEPLRRFYAKAEEWFAIRAGAADEIIKGVTGSAKEVAGLLKVNTGPAANPKKILEEARRQLILVKVPESQEEIDAGIGLDEACAESVDELTGLPNRLRFDQTMVAAVEQARAGTGPLGVVIFEVDGLTEIAGTYGRDAADSVLITVAATIKAAYRGTCGLVCRYSDSRIAVVMPRTDQLSVVRVAEAARVSVEGSPIDMIAGRNVPPTLSVTVSVGLASVCERALAKIENVVALTELTERALAAAQRQGRNTTRVFAPRAA